ncbi:unnamed protein product [Prorocentrum cordatum]|uniref:Uncharacterized protein n=1 Tax=Prorocentrum cordatum TaxID=2364126 RepID=A0ABN9REH0_9DINO|nr:unnamed protein product [Polarella glacialis]
MPEPFVATAQRGGWTETSHSVRAQLRERRPATVAEQMAGSDTTWTYAVTGTTVPDNLSKAQRGWASMEPKVVPQAYFSCWHPPISVEHGSNGYGSWWAFSGCTMRVGYVDKKPDKTNQDTDVICLCKRKTAACSLCGRGVAQQKGADPEWRAMVAAPAPPPGTRGITPAGVPPPWPAQAGPGAAQQCTRVSEADRADWIMGEAEEDLRRKKQLQRQEATSAAAAASGPATPREQRSRKTENGEEIAEVIKMLKDMSTKQEQQQNAINQPTKITSGQMHAMALLQSQMQAQSPVKEQHLVKEQPQNMSPGQSSQQPAPSQERKPGPTEPIPTAMARASDASDQGGNLLSSTTISSIDLPMSGLPSQQSVAVPPRKRNSRPSKPSAEHGDPWTETPEAKQARDRRRREAEEAAKREKDRLTRDGWTAAGWKSRGGKGQNWVDDDQMWDKSGQKKCQAFQRHFDIEWEENGQVRFKCPELDDSMFHEIAEAQRQKDGESLLLLGLSMEIAMTQVEGAASRTASERNGAAGRGARQSAVDAKGICDALSKLTAGSKSDRSDHTLRFVLQLLVPQEQPREAVSRPPGQLGLPDPHQLLAGAQLGAPWEAPCPQFAPQGGGWQAPTGGGWEAQQGSHGSRLGGYPPPGGPAGAMGGPWQQNDQLLAAGRHPAAPAGGDEQGYDDQGYDEDEDLAGGRAVSSTSGVPGGSAPEVLFDAVTRGDVAVVQEMLESGIDVNKSTERGSHVIFRAVIKAHSPDVVVLLLNARADVRSSDSKGNSVMHFWARATVGRNTLKAIGEALVQAGAAVDAQRSTDGTRERGRLRLRGSGGSEDGHALLPGLLAPPQVAALRRAAVAARRSKRLEARRHALRTTLGLSWSEAEALAPEEVEHLCGRHLRSGRGAPSFMQYFNLWRGSQDVRRVALALGTAAAALLGVARVRLYGDALFVKRPGDTATGWHTDAEHVPLDTDRYLTLWVPLQAVMFKQLRKHELSETQADLLLDRR